MEADEESEGKELSGERTTLYRALAATLNYLALDRADLAYAAKEASRKMSRPAEEDFAMIKRATRYLKTKPRAVIWYKWQDQEAYVDAYTDSDWAGCRVTRKSTIGGALMCGRHLIKTS